ncbi:MAG: lysoplasmalogenase [Bacteroidota bacterium]
MNLKKFFLLLFALSLLGDLVAVHFSSPLELWFKPGILASLIGYYLAAAQGNVGRKFLIALILCLIGDVMLMIDRGNPTYFIGGLMAFLSAHIVYIQVFRGLINPERTAGTRYELLPFIFLIIISGILVLVILYKDLNEMLPAVTIYTIAISLMTIQALMRKGKTVPVSFYLTLAGAVLFMISDIALAVSRFKAPFEHSGLMIMSTYAIAQLLIVLGVLRHE